MRRADPEWQIAADLADTVTDDYQDVQKKTNAAITDANILQAAYVADLADLAGLAILAGVGAGGGVVGLASLSELVERWPRGNPWQRRSAAASLLPSLSMDIQEFVEHVDDAVQGAVQLYNDAVKIGTDNSFAAIEADAENANKAAANLKGLIEDSVNYLAGLSR